ncbi:hypothetical protein [Maridesulfovibrio sp.]
MKILLVGAAVLVRVIVGIVGRSQFKSHNTQEKLNLIYYLF